MIKTGLLFFATALAEIIGCFLPYLWLRKEGSPWLLLPAASSLAAFVWLLTLHPAASGPVYAAYGGVYVATALLWLRVVDGVKLSAFDWLGAGIALLGMGIIASAWKPAVWMEGCLSLGSVLIFCPNGCFAIFFSLIQPCV